MKSLIKKRWFPLIVAVSILALTASAVIAMILFGWRFVFVPELENDWDAISAVATWVGAFVSAVGVVSSFVAIWYAIQVPKEIAEQQNKIALFEKRLECNKALECLITFSKYSQHFSNTYRQLFFALGVFLDFPEISDDRVLHGKTSHNFIVNFQITVLSGAYLFENYDVELVQSATLIVQELVTGMLVANGTPDDPLSKDITACLTKLTELCKEIEDTVIPSIADEIAIDSIWG